MGYIIAFFLGEFSTFLILALLSANKKHDSGGGNNEVD